MKHKSTMLFPAVLMRLRADAGLRQKDLAAEARVSQSFLCAVERGRRSTPASQVVDRLASALAGRLGQAGIAELRWAAQHDYVLQWLPEMGFTRAAPLVSAALLAERCLSDRELNGVLAQVRLATRSREYLDGLPTDAALEREEEQSM